MPDQTTSIIVDVLKVVGLPGFICWLWAQDRKNIAASMDGMSGALHYLAEKVGGAVEAARNNHTT